MKTDSPVKIETQDFLKRYPFAKDLVNGLLSNFENGQDSVVIGINGEWGSGKSSLLEFVKTEFEIQTTDEPFRNYLFEFNPWRIINQDDLQVQFLKELGIILGNYSIAHEQLKEDFKKFANVASDANKGNKEPISKISIGGIASIIKNFTKETSLLDLKKEVDERLEDDNIKMLILIDDIDRLPPKEIAQIFQLVKLNANFKNTYFIIAFDKHVVTKALSDEYGLNGEKYIEKIVQIDYTLPTIPSEDISYIFSDELRKIFTKQNLNVQLDLIGNIWDKKLKFYYTTIRHIYRFCNALELRLPPICNDINIIDFILIETIRIFDFRVYEWVYKNYEKLTLARKSELSFVFGNMGHNKTDINEDLEKTISESEVLQNIPSHTIDIIKNLFSLKSGFGYEQLKDDLNKEKRIASLDYFEHYFSFKILSNNVPDSDYEKFITTDSQGRKEILTYYKEKNLLYKFLKGLVYKVQKVEDKSTIDSFYEELLDYCDEELLGFVTEHFEQSGWFVIVSFLIDISDSYDGSAGYDLLFENLLIQKVSYTRYFVLAFLRNRVVVNNNYQVVATIPEEIIVQYKDRITERQKELLFVYAESLKDNSYQLEEFTRTDILRTLYEVDSAKYDEIIEELLKIDEYAVLLFKHSLTRYLKLNEVGFQISDERHIMPNLTVKRLDEKLSKIKVESYEGKFKEFLSLFNNLKEKSFDKNIFLTLEGKQIDEI
ncbi:MAG: hypothetical protein JW870_04530 [Candidatus Delongbacteria bacterium]|nr:hypothetical protein [Candidatus Delongbacteria bacterium]